SPLWVHTCMLGDSTMRLSTIGLLVTLAFGMLWAPSPSLAQSVAKIPRIGILTYAFQPYSGFEAFHRGLRDLGYVEGQNIVIESRFAALSLEKLPDLVAELIRLKVDIIVALGGP